MSARLGHGVTLLLAVSWLLVATVTPVPAVGATGPVVDGGFEAGTPNPYWGEHSDNYGTPLCSEGTCGHPGARSGEWWAWFGGIDAEEAGAVTQEVIIGPADTTLTFYLWIQNADVSSYLNVEIDNDVVFSATELDDLAYSDYTEIVVNISAYADGASHTLEFVSLKAAGGSANYHVDDISIGGGAPSTATVTGIVRHAGVPLAGVEVWLGGSRYVCTAGDGTFSFTEVPVGVPLVAATGPAVALPCSNAAFVNSSGQPLAMQAWDHKTATESWDQFALSAGEVRNLEFDVALRRAPTAIDDTAAVENAGVVMIAVTANDTNPEGAALDVIKASDPAHGSATWNSADGGFVYSHDGSATTTDAFTYKLDDSVLASNAATVFISIAPLPEPDADPPATIPPEAPTVGLQDPSTGQWHLKDAAGAVTTFYFGNPGDISFVGDWDCNGTATPGLFRQSDAYAYLRNANSQGNADIRFFFGNPSDIPLAGDFDGDGCDTLSIYRPAEQRFFIMNKLGANEGGLGAADYSFVFGNPGDKPVVGDWDGDGIDEIGLHRESSGFFYFRNTLSQGNADGQLYFGDPGDRFVAGDWGVVDFQDTPAVFRPSSTGFYFRHTMTPGNADSWLTWGESGFMPLAGNFGALSGGPMGGGHPTSGDGWRLLACDGATETSIFATSDACAQLLVEISLIPQYRDCNYATIPPKCTYHSQHQMRWYGPNDVLLSSSEQLLYSLETGLVAKVSFSTQIAGRGLAPGEYRAVLCRTQWPQNSVCVADVLTAHFTITN